MCGSKAPPPVILPPPAPKVEDTTEKRRRNKKIQALATGHEDTILSGGQGVIGMEKIKQRKLTGSS